MAGGQGQRDAAIALKDTVGSAADDITSKAADFHEITAAASVDGAHAFGDVDTQFGDTLDGIGRDPESVANPTPDDGAGASGGSGGDGQSGPVDDNFQGTGEGGQQPEGNDNTPACKDPVDPISGQMLCAQVDLELPGILPLVLRRAYASSYRHGKLFGPGWSSTLDQRLVIDQDGIHFLGDDAQQLDYPVPTQPGQQVLPAAGARWPLVWDRKLDGIAITDPATGWTRHFAPPPRDARPGPGPRPGKRETRHLVRITDRNGNWLAITRDADGVPTRIDHSGGYQVEIDSGYRAGGFRIEALRVPADSGGQGVEVRAFGYDPAGRLVEIADAEGVPYIYEYDADDRITAWIDRTGYRYEYRYDTAGRVVWAAGQDGTLSGSFEYDEQARLTRVSDSFGQFTEYHYDAHHHVTKVVDPLGAVTTSVHDRYGRLLEHTDALGSTTRFTLNRHGDPVRLERPDGSVVQAEYSDLGLPTRVVGADGGVWSYSYDERGNLLNVTDPTGAVTSYAYRENGAVAAETDPLGRRVSIDTDRAGLPVKLTGPLGEVWQVERDRSGRVVRSADPAGAVTSTVYDIAGRPITQTHPDGSGERWEWDATGELTAHTNQAGFTTRFETGPFHLLLARQEADGTTYRFTHDAERRLTKVENPQGRAWTYEYDVVGNLIGECDFNGRALGYEVDAAGRVIARRTGAGQRIELDRDALGRVTAQRADGVELTFAYDANGNLRQGRNAHSEVTYTRDAIGRVTSETLDSRALSSAYDAAGQRVGLATPNGVESAWEYDAAGQPAALTTSGHRLSFGYDEIGRESYRWIGPLTAIAETHDQLGRVISRQLLRADGPNDPATGRATSRLIEQRAWTYRADGTPTAIDETIRGRQTLELDPLGRVTAVQAATWTETYAYDAAGNLTNAADSRNPESATSGPREVDGTLLRAAGRTRYEHDAQGRLVKATRRTLSGSSKTWSYTYDPFDHLIEATNPQGVTWRYTYDALGRRISKQRLDADGALVEEYRYTWDGPRLIEQEHRTAARSTRACTTWTYEPGTFTPLAQASYVLDEADPAAALDQQFHAVITDLIGTPTELVTPDGEVVWRRQADLWGAPLATDASTPTGVGESATARIDCPLRFPGQYHDDETGLDYNLYRYYDPAAGRFLTPDPLGLTPAPNQHAYVGNPLLWLDPLGLQSILGTAFSWRASQIQHVRFNPRYPDGGPKFNSTTTAVVRAQTPEGHYVDVVAGSGRDGLSGAQKAMLNRHATIPEIAAPNVPNLDAEMTAKAHIESQGWSMVGGGASRNVCPWCENEIRDADGHLTGDLTAGRVNNRPYQGEREFEVGGTGTGCSGGAGA